METTRRTKVSTIVVLFVGWLSAIGFAMASETASSARRRCHQIDADFTSEVTSENCTAVRGGDPASRRDRSVIAEWVIR